MDSLSKKLIELEPWEAEKMNIGLKYLIETHFKNSENFKDVSDESLKAVSWLIAFRHLTFDDKVMKLPENVSQEAINTQA